MSIVRLLHVKVDADQCDSAERAWNEHCAPLMIEQPGCLAEKLLKSSEVPGEYISYSEWDSDESIERYRQSAAHETIKNQGRGLQQQAPIQVKKYEVVT